MKYLLICILLLSFSIGCTEKKTTKIQTESGKEVEIPTTTTYSYYASPLPGEEATILLIKESNAAELYRTNDTLYSDLTNDEEEEFTAATVAIPEWNKRYESNPANEYEEIRKIAPRSETSIYRTTGSEAPAAVARLLKVCKTVAERLRREKDGKKLPV